MPKKLIALLIVFFITFTGFIYTEFLYVLPAIITPSPTPVASANLSFAPNPLTTTASESAQVDVILESNTKPDLVQLEIAFDPKVLFNVQISPSDYFTNSEVVLYNVDAKNGRISYGLSGKNSGEARPSSARHTIAVITFNTYNYNEIQKETNLSFLPKTLVRKDVGEIKLESTGIAKIVY